MVVLFPSTVLGANTIKAAKAASRSNSPFSLKLIAASVFAPRAPNCIESTPHTSQKRLQYPQWLDFAARVLGAMPMCLTAQTFLSSSIRVI